MRRTGNAKTNALALALLGLSLLAWVWDGKAADFIDARLVVLIFPAGLVCVVLAQVVLADAKADRKEESLPQDEKPAEPTGDLLGPGWGLLWIAIPLIIGFMFL